MITMNEVFLLSTFSQNEQKIIASEIYEKYNTTNQEAIKAAISDAVWQGFCKGMEYSTKGSKA